MCLGAQVTRREAKECILMMWLCECAEEGRHLSQPLPDWASMQTLPTPLVPPPATFWQLNAFFHCDCPYTTCKYIVWALNKSFVKSHLKSLLSTWVHTEEGIFYFISQHSGLMDGFEGGVGVGAGGESNLPPCHTACEQVFVLYFVFVILMGQEVTVSGHCKKGCC